MKTVSNYRSCTTFGSNKQKVEEKTIKKAYWIYEFYLKLITLFLTDQQGYFILKIKEKYVNLFLKGSYK